MSIYNQYETVIGLEVHAQLLTESKMYSEDPTSYGAAPNTNVSPVSLGHPGTLPVLNKKAIEFAVKLGLACNCKIREENRFARKNYFYADLPKGYQITQDDTPICYDGYLMVKDDKNVEKKFGITRIHMEEDSGKSIHDQDPFNTLIDLNRAGTPLLEVVSEPDMRSPEDAYNYLSEIRKLVRYLDICDGNMEEGSLRCDANISVMKNGSEIFGEKVEVKNMNSISNVRRAIAYEVKRQIDVLESGGKIDQETRSYDAVKGVTFSMRTKEMAHDYRYFTEPDLQPVFVTDNFIEDVKNNLPPLPRQLYKKYVSDLKLSEYDAGVLTETKSIALYFEELIKHTKNYKAASNWVMGDIKSYLNENAIEIAGFSVSPEKIAKLIQLIDGEKVSNSVASQKIFPKMIIETDKSPEEIAKENNWIQENDEGSLREYVDQAISKYPDKVEEYQSGKKGLVGLFMGEVMKLSKGKADPKKANQLVREVLENKQ